MNFEFDATERDTDSFVPLDENDLDEAGEELTYFDFCQQEHDRTVRNPRRETQETLNRLVRTVRA